MALLEAFKHFKRRLLYRLQVLIILLTTPEHVYTGMYALRVRLIATVKKEIVLCYICRPGYL